MSPMMESEERRRLLLLLKMEQDMKENGIWILTKEMEKDTKSGLMDLSMKDTGRMIKLTEEED